MTHDRTTVHLERVRIEMVELLAAMGEAELNVLYRALMDLLGAGAFSQIGATIAGLVREGALEIETRRRIPEGPFVGIARLARPPAPPYASILA